MIRDLKETIKGKKKAITFSFDDGVGQDERTIEILAEYGLKATFNLNSGRFGQEFPFDHNGKRIERQICAENRIKDIYKDHEIAVHTVNHKNLTALSKQEIIEEVVEDQKRLEDLCGYEIIGMAYPCGGVNNDDRVAEIIRENTGIKYSRTITSNYNFDLQNNLLRFDPTVHIKYEKLFETGEKFIELKTESPKILYVWGHTYEFDMIENGWERFEEFCALISGKDDIFYGTNREVLL